MLPRKPYPSDLTDEEYALIEPLLPACKSGKPQGGRPEKHPRREILNAIRYIVRSGGAWRMMPHDLPSWGTAYFYFRQWSREDTWNQIHTVLREQARVTEKRDPEPSAAIIDSQSVKTTEVGGERGYDSGKKVKGRKRHLLVDVLGLVLAVLVHPAHIQDRDGARALLERIQDAFPRLQLIFADGAYAGALLQWVAQLRRRNPLRMEIIKRKKGIKGFQLLPHRWKVERTFAWLGRHRRMSKDYEKLPQTGEALVHVIMIGLMLRRRAAAVAGGSGHPASGPLAGRGPGG